jgi:hypothetical protein
MIQRPNTAAFSLALARAPTQDAAPGFLCFDQVADAFGKQQDPASSRPAVDGAQFWYRSLGTFEHGGFRIGAYKGD